ncbi:MAG: hypothetical protein JKY92_06070 [Magnetovibrio sp.]|nr:hypothetical protein [Magnetovibrio sp.]
MASQVSAAVSGASDRSTSNANLPKSHDDTMGWSASGRANGQSYSDDNQARLICLQNAIAKANQMNPQDRTLTYLIIRFCARLAAGYDIETFVDFGR